MHRRKKYIIYKLGYSPKIDTPRTRYSKYQALKCAAKLGAGAQVMVCIYQYPGPFKLWTGTWSRWLNI